MTTPSTIAIDGPAASGKSTVSALLAQELEYLFFDTGVMYRAVTWAAIDRNIDVQDTETVSELAETLRIEVTSEGPDDGRQYTVLVDGQDVTWEIRQSEVNKNVSLVSSYRRVRHALTEQQRRIASQGSIVMVGRDIGTVVLPEADLKIFLEASARKRAERRVKDCSDQGRQADFEEILASIRERDRQDRENPISPLVPAEDAIIVNTDEMNIQETVAYLKQLVLDKNNGH